MATAMTTETRKQKVIDLISKIKPLVPSLHERRCKTWPDRKGNATVVLVSKIIISSLAIVAASISLEILLKNLGYDHVTEPSTIQLKKCIG